MVEEMKIIVDHSVNTLKEGKNESTNSNATDSMRRKEEERFVKLFPLVHYALSYNVPIDTFFESGFRKGNGRSSLGRRVRPHL